MLVDWQPHARALVEARAWCALHLDPTRPAESMRPPALCPPRYPRGWMYGALDCEAFASLIDRRRSLLADPTPTGAPGRILCVVGDLDAAMGEGTVESNGVVDDTYLPPWDTWFACLHTGEHALLLARIPRGHDCCSRAHLRRAMKKLKLSKELPGVQDAGSTLATIARMSRTQRGYPGECRDRRSELLDIPVGDTSRCAALKSAVVPCGPEVAMRPVCSA